jgi:hypothetical protein
MQSQIARSVASDVRATAIGSEGRAINPEFRRLPTSRIRQHVLEHPPRRVNHR